MRSKELVQKCMKNLTISMAEMATRLKEIEKKYRPKAVAEYYENGVKITRYEASNG